MDSPRFKRENALYLLAFGLALALRLVRLGVFPLTDLEASAALSALDVAGGLRTAIGPNPLYALLTGAFFFAFDSTNFFARLAPALTGSLLVFAPLLFRHRLKPRASLILAFLVAFDPGLLALSRQAGSSIFALAFLLLAWGFWERGQARWGGVCAALSLLGGPALWPGLFGLGVTWAILQGVIYRSETEPGSLSRVGWRDAWPAFLAVLVLLGTGFFLVPSGLGGIFNGLVDYLGGWRGSSGVAGWQLSLSLVFYQPLALLFAVIGLARGWWVGSRRVIRLSVWMLAALVLAVFYPGRQVHDLAWMLIPLLALAALELSRHMDLRKVESAEAGGVAALTAILLIFAWLDLAGLLWDMPGTERGNLRMVMLVGALLLLVVSLLLVAVGWSLRVARLGGVWGVVVALGLGTLAAGLGAGHIRAEYSSEMWDAGAYPAHADLLAATAGELSEWGVGIENGLPITISGLDSPAVLWALHRHELTVVDALDASTAPAILVTPLQNEPVLAASYRGQDFTWNQRPAWDTVGFNEWLRWAVLREMPQNFDTILLWARSDLFIDAP